MTTQGTMESQQTEYERLNHIVGKMKQASDLFYKAAINTGNHAFIEFTGLINEYIGACRNAVKTEQDFTMLNKHTGEHLKFQPFQADYLYEKLECIYGSDMMNKLCQTIIAKQGSKHEPHGE